MQEARRIPVTTGSGGSPEGGNSAYVLPDRGLVVDPGPPGDGAWRRLREGLDDAGVGVDGVDHVLVTHWHADHVGAAPRLAAEADATLALHERDAPLIGDYAAERARRLERDARVLERWGVPDDRVEPLVEFDSPSPVPDSFPVRSLADGDTVAGVEVLHTPGHTAGHAAFVLDDHAFVGDAVLTTCTPNVGGGDTRQEAPLTDYRETLSRLEDRVRVAHPGHGSEFELEPRTGTLRAHHRDRSSRVVTVLDGEGPVTPWTLARTLFGEMEGYHVKFGAGEAFAHLEHLDRLGVVDRCGDDPVTFRRSDVTAAAADRRLSAAFAPEA
ncbi:MBL fold metallo-hydrolase [Haloarchaeobius sp. HRN-SO-5]|uniref:MBL fold metallo-hydrolase n=1 Tax=Haloarchaeobius sp. HRN-SO-5 TaxID=3446118 RepID=UPI003EBC2A4A